MRKPTKTEAFMVRYNQKRRRDAIDKLTRALGDFGLAEIEILAEAIYTGSINVTLKSLRYGGMAAFDQACVNDKIATPKQIELVRSRGRRR